MASSLGRHYSSPSLPISTGHTALRSSRWCSKIASSLSFVATSLAAAYAGENMEETGLGNNSNHFMRSKQGLNEYFRFFASGLSSQDNLTNIVYSYSSHNCLCERSKGEIGVKGQFQPLYKKQNKVCMNILIFVQGASYFLHLMVVILIRSTLRNEMLLINERR